MIKTYKTIIITFEVDIKRKTRSKLRSDQIVLVQYSFKIFGFSFFCPISNNWTHLSLIENSLWATFI